MSLSKFKLPAEDFEFTGPQGKSHGKDGSEVHSRRFRAEIDPDRDSDPDYSPSYYQTRSMRSGRKGLGGRKLKCPYKVCNYVAMTKTDLSRHKATHSGVKPFQCTWPACNKRYMAKQSLQDHMRFHTGERPYHCTWPGCDKRFALKQYLTVHTRTHTGEKPYKCSSPGCGAAISQSGNLNAHAQTHIEEQSSGDPFDPKDSGCELTVDLDPNAWETPQICQQMESLNIGDSHAEPDEQESFDGNLPEADKDEFVYENADYNVQQEKPNNDDENFVGADKTVIEYCEQTREIVIRSGNSRTVHHYKLKGLLVEDRDGGDFAIPLGQRIPLLDFLRQTR